MTTDALFFDDIKEITTEKLYQYDIGQKLKISGFDINENTEVHFKSPYSKIAKIATGTLNGSSLTVVIPDEFLESAGNGKVWVCSIDENEVTTIRTINIPIVERAKPDGYVSKADGSYRKFNEEIADLNNNKANKEEVSAEIANAKSEAITKADSMIDDYDKTQVQPALAKKADKADSLAGYGITDAYDKTYINRLLNNKLNKMPFDTVPAANSPNYVTSGTVYNSVNTLNQSINKKADKQDVEEKIEKSSNMNFKKFSNITTVATARPLYIDGRYLYHTGNSSYAVSKIDVGIESAPTQIAKIGGHKNFYPREMSAGNGYLYIPYRDNKAATGTSFDANTDIGGYLDIIKLSDFTLVRTITYPRKPLNPNDGKGVRYFGKSHYTATYKDKYLCVTQQMGGWLLYDISTTPENPQLLYEYDNREQCYIDNVGGKGYAEFQQPAFFDNGNGNVYLAIAGYDRDLLKIYDLTTPTAPTCVYTCNLRALYNGNLTTPYLHTLGVAVSYPYIYCTVAPYPGKAIGMTMEGLAVVNVADINNISVTLHAMPDSDRATESTGEPAPCSIALRENYLFTDNAEKGFAVWTITNPAIPTYVGNISTGTQVCSVQTTDDGRIFCGSTYKNKKINIYR